MFFSLPEAVVSKHFNISEKDGFTSNFKYLPNEINPQQAYDIYKEGYGGGPLGGFFEKYKIKVFIMK